MIKIRKTVLEGYFIFTISYHMSHMIWVIISGTQILLTSLAPSSYGEFSMSMFELNVTRAPETSSIFGSQTGTPTDYNMSHIIWLILFKVHIVWTRSYGSIFTNYWIFHPSVRESLDPWRSVDPWSRRHIFMGRSLSWNLSSGRTRTGQMLQILRRGRNQPGNVLRTPGSKIKKNLDFSR